MSIRNFRIATAPAAVVLAFILAGCASVLVGVNNDPYEAFNRDMFDVNTALDKAVLRPVADGDNDVVPKRARTRVHDALVNLNEPVVFSNLLPQGELIDAGGTLVRFVLNSSISVGGLIGVGSRASCRAC